MMGKTKRVVALVTIGGMAFGWGFGGCLNGDGFWGRLVWDAALDIGWDFLTDNDAVFDLFQDDFGTGTMYDDRFVAAPTRVEPDGFTQVVGNAN